MAGYVFGNNSGMTTGTTSVVGTLPSGWSVGSLLLAYTSTNGNGQTITTPSGWTLISPNVNTTACKLYARIAQAGDTAPTFTWSGGQVCCDIAYFTGDVFTDLTTIVTNSNDRASTSTNNIVLNAGSLTPSQDNSLVICGGRIRKTATSDGSTVTQPAFAPTRLSLAQPNGGNQSSIWDYQIQTTSTTIALNQVHVKGTADTSDNTQGFMVVLKPSPVTTIRDPVLTPTSLYAKRKNDYVHQSWSSPIALLVGTPPPVFPPSVKDWIVPKGRTFPVSLRGDSQNLLESTLFGQDRVLTAVSWDYEWDKPSLPTAMHESYGLSLAELTALSTTIPYIEYEWPVPRGAKQYNRGFEFSFPLELIGQDKILAGGIQNNMWDPPKGRAFATENRTWDQPGLSLLTITPVRPPISVSDWPVPQRARRVVQDYIAGIPEALLDTLVKFPAFLPSTDLPSWANAFARARVAIRAENHSLTAEELTALLTFVPLVPQNGLWPLPLRPPLRIENLALTSSGLALFLTPPPPPPPPVDTGSGRPMLVLMSDGELLDTFPVGKGQTAMSAASYGLLKVNEPVKQLPGSNPNAPAGFGGQKWGARGGGIEPPGGAT